jgi:hypothetical protein
MSNPCLQAAPTALSDGTPVGVSYIYKDQVNRIAVNNSHSITRNTYGATAPKSASFLLEFQLYAIGTSGSNVLQFWLADSSPAWIPASTDIANGSGIVYLAEGMQVTCPTNPGIPANTTIASITADGITLSNNLTANIQIGVTICVADGFAYDNSAFALLCFATEADLASFVYSPMTVSGAGINPNAQPQVLSCSSNGENVIIKSTIPGQAVISSAIPPGTPITFSTPNGVLPSAWGQTQTNGYQPSNGAFVPVVIPAKNGLGYYGPQNATDPTTYLIQLASLALPPHTLVAIVLGGVRTYFETV